jgi:(4-(4-[2-(gamma-L-glutamylamino)ethyl]phenoxymethyl)furan-2-yl)methanamine synthase
MTSVIGWDLGGANVKVALIEHGRVAHVAQIPCPPLADRGKFNAGIAAAVALVPGTARHAVTMTGELSDVFADRREGVAYLVDLMMDTVGGQELLIYAGEAGFLAPEDAKRLPVQVASANWHATAALAARHYPDALLVDAGTTTTDLVPIRGGAVEARGTSDSTRLTEGELVYRGVVRTPVMAVAATAPFGGRRQRLAAERFATMADVFRLTGDLPEDADPYPTADQRGKSMAESAARLARMLGRDADEAPLADWVALARYFVDCQRADVSAAALEVMTRETLPAGAPVIGAGCGRFLARTLARQLGRPYVDFAELLDVVPEAREAATRCAPAVAVALLALSGPLSAP